mgnify:CR=1 FL=1
MTKEQFEPPLHFEKWLQREETSIVEKYYSSMAWQRRVVAQGVLRVEGVDHILASDTCPTLVDAHLLVIRVLLGDSFAPRQCYR